MKSNTLRLLLAAAAGMLASIAYAGPGPQYWDTMRHDTQFKQLKTGDKVAFVCNECKTVSEITIKSPEHAMEICKEGATVVCPSCSMKTKVTMKAARNNPATEKTVTYVNDKGEECAFMAKMPVSN